MPNRKNKSSPVPQQPEVSASQITSSDIEHILPKQTGVGSPLITGIGAIIDEKIKDINEITRLVIIVLFVGFLTLLFSLTAIFVQYLGVKTNSDIQLMNAINQLEIEIHDLKQGTNSATIKQK